MTSPSLVRRVARVEEGSYRAALRVLCSSLILVGVVLRVFCLDRPRDFVWDEYHFVVNARNYLWHRPDLNDHAPLGKLFIGACLSLFGDVSWSWRVAPLVCGLITTFLAAVLAARLYEDRDAGFLAAAFVAGDGFLITYSRLALLDGMLVTLVLASVVFVTSEGIAGALLGALSIGLAASVKETGAILLLPFVGLCLWRRTPQRAFAAVLSPVAFIAVTMLGLGLGGERATPLAAVRSASTMLRGHLGATYFTHPMTSHWYEWLLPTRPIPLHVVSTGPGAVQALNSIGNLLLWWSVSILLVASPWIFWRALRRRAGAARRELATPLLLLFSTSLLLPWMVSRVDSYIYHYLPTYTLALVTLGGLGGRLFRKRPELVLTFVGAVTAVTAFYAPLWCGAELSWSAYEARLFLPGWR